MKSESTVDLEHDGQRDDRLVNHTIQVFTWRKISVNVLLARSKPQMVLSELDGLVSAGKYFRNDT